MENKYKGKKKWKQNGNIYLEEIGKEKNNPKKLKKKQRKREKTKV